MLLLIGRNPYPIAEIQQRQPVATFVPFGLGSSPSERLFQEGKATLVVFDTIHAELQLLYGDQAEMRYAVSWKAFMRVSKARTVASIGKRLHSGSWIRRPPPDFHQGLKGLVDLTDTAQELHHHAERVRPAAASPCASAILWAWPC